MTITLGLWQIAGLIVLTLTVVGILKRLATLIAMVVLGNWYKATRSATGLNELSRPKSDFDEKASNTAIYGDATPWQKADFAMGYTTPELESAGEPFSGSTGSTTSGVAYVPAAAVLRSKTSPVYRGKKWGRKV